MPVQDLSRSGVMRNGDEFCPLCTRPLAGPCNRHHLLPISEGGAGTTTVWMHKICHDKIHAVFTEKELKRYYHTVDRLRESEEIRRFLEWIVRKEPEYYDRTVRKKR